MLETLEARRLLTVTLENGILTITGTPHHDLLVVGRHGQNVVVRDNGTMHQFPAADVDGVVMNGLGGNDRLIVHASPHGPFTKPVTLNGGEGNDMLMGGDGADELNGGEGNDLMVGGRGPDIFNGGDGVDTVDYSHVPLDLVITLDGIADDGAVLPGGGSEGDNVMPDVENIRGGHGNDLIVGSDAANYFLGGPGNDTLMGMGGNDQLVGGPGSDSLLGGDGDDRIFSRDNEPDFVDGGDGVDHALVDPLDTVVNVEFVRGGSTSSIFGTAETRDDRLEELD